MFNPNNLDTGKHMVVGNCNGIEMKDRWNNETPIFTELIMKYMGDAKTVLDYGCGVGRIAREILEKSKSVEKLIGADNSQEMLNTAEKYVLSDRFVPVLTNHLVGHYDFTYCVYVLQHVPALELRDVIRQLAESSDKVFVVNSKVRMAVHGEGFVDDGINIIDELSRYFNTITWGIPFKHIQNNWVMRKMFLEGDILHYGVICQNVKTQNNTQATSVSW